VKIFPRDCSGCENLKSWDMSVDDWTNVCLVNKMQVDDCDMDFESCICPEKRTKYCKGEHIMNIKQFISLVIICIIGSVINACILHGSV
jgi:hypothetical protein